MDTAVPAVISTEVEVLFADVPVVDGVDGGMATECKAKGSQSS
jgi:hypothetical protein